jgi:hypothetical protein
MKSKHHEDAVDRLLHIMPLDVDFDVYPALDISGAPLSFDPWYIFEGVFYGVYSSDFDDTAIDVLNEVWWNESVRQDTAAYMFREALCCLGLCKYGSSPRACFPTPEFKAQLPKLIEKWEMYRATKWSY